MFTKAGAVAPLAEILRDEKSIAQEYAAEILRKIGAADAKAAAELADMHVLASLVRAIVDFTGY